MGKIWEFGQFGKATALMDEHGNQLTYDVLDSEAQILAEKIGQRCLVFSLCRNEIGSVLGYVSFINHAIVPVLLNSHLEENLMENLLETYEPSYLWIPKDQMNQFSGMEAVYEAYH